LKVIPIQCKDLLTLKLKYLGQVSTISLPHPNAVSCSVYPSSQFETKDAV
jgi:hypothetical protein